MDSQKALYYTSKLKKIPMKKKLLLSFVLVICVNFGFSQELWTKTSIERLEKSPKIHRSSQPMSFGVYKLNLEALKSRLVNAPMRGDLLAKNSSVQISFPNVSGEFEKFNIIEAPIMEAALAEKYPMIKSYAAQGVNDPSATMRFTVTQFGLHTMTLSGTKGSWFIDPYTEDRSSYMVYGKVALGNDFNEFRCLTEDDVDLPSLRGDVSMQKATDDDKLRTYRLAQSCTAEYGSIFRAGATVDATIKANIQAQMAITMARVNGIYERDLAITMVFVANNDQVIYYGQGAAYDDYSADPWTNEWNTKTAQTIDAAIGVGNYDIGHNFNTTGGGNAGCLGCVCLSTSQSGTHKGRGYTGRADPTGDPFDVDYVAHEMGHQFNGWHTMNTCSRSGNNTEVEPASGSTIMGYAGICTSNIQSNSDAYFNYVNIRDISSNVQPGGNSDCIAGTAIGNAAPTADAGSNWTIPMSTPYMLIGSSTDADGTGSHTFTWEQNDTETAPNGEAPPAEASTTGPMTRSFTGTTNPIRYIPRLQDLVNSGGGSTTWEVLPSVNRNMEFALTVRDNNAGGGQTADALMTVTTTTTAGPFRVTSQSAITTWSPGNSETITWAVAGTDSGIVNTPTVDILLSLDGGLTFPTTLATGVPNNGSSDVIVPASLSNNCRVMVKGNGHVFFNINSSKFAIGYNINSACASFEDNVPKVLPTSASAYTNYSISVSGMSGTVSDVNVYVDIDSNRMNETYVAMNGPGGAAAYYSTIYQAGCAQNQRDLQVLFDDSASAFSCSTPGPNTGTYAPTGDFTVMNGSSPNDLWYFRAANTGTTTVTVNSFRFDVCTEEAVLSPIRTNIGTLSVAPLASGTYLNSHIESTSPNTGVLTNIVYTIVPGQLPANGTVYLNAVALGASDTFTQDDLNTGKVTYTTTLSGAGTDSFRVDLDDQNGGTLTNLKVDMIIDPVLGIGNVEFEQFSIYPIPNKGVFTIKLKSNSRKDIEVRVNDIRGRKVYAKIFGGITEFSQEIKLNSLQAGVYLVAVTDGDYKAVRKIIVE